MNGATARRAIGRRRDRQRGLAVVEFAVSMGVLLLLMLGTAEIGRIWFSYNTLNKAVRTGSRYLSDKVLNGAGAVALTAAETGRAQNMVVHEDFDGSRPAVLPAFVIGDVVVSVQDPPGEFRPYVRILATYDYTPMIGTLATFGFGSPIDLSFTMTAASTMRVQK